MIGPPDGIVHAISLAVISLVAISSPHNKRPASICLSVEVLDDERNRCGGSPTLDWVICVMFESSYNSLVI